MGLNQKHWLKMEEEKLERFLNQRGVREASAEEYADFIEAFLGRGEKLCFYSDRPADEDFIIVESSKAQIPRLESAVAQKIIIGERSNTTSALSSSFNTAGSFFDSKYTPQKIGDNVIYDRSSGAVAGYNKVTLTKKSLGVLKSRGYSLDSIRGAFYKDRELPEMLRDKDRDFEKLEEDFLAACAIPSVALTRKLRVRKARKIDSPENK